jgi:hypothetical protein
MNVLVSLDQLVNSVLAGDPDETISSRLGRIKAKYGGKIPWTRPVARITERILNKIQRRHVEQSVEPAGGDRGLVDRPPGVKCRCGHRAQLHSRQAGCCLLCQCGAFKLPRWR